MVTLKVSLSKSDKEFVDEQVKARGDRSTNRYFAELLEREQIAQERARIDQLLLEGLNSGPATPLTKEDFAAIKREGLAILNGERKRVSKGRQKPQRAKRSA